MANSLTGFTIAQNGVSLAQNSLNALSSGAKGLVGESSTMYRYPLDRIDDQTDYLQIKISDYVLSSKPFTVSSSAPYINVESYSERVSKRGDESVKYRILLPIPQGIADSLSVSWDQEGINAAEAVGLSVASGAMQDPYGAVQNAANSVLSGLKNIDPTTQNMLTNVLAGRAVNSLGGNVSITGLISRATGSILNNNLELLFQGVNLRTFAFSFDFSPRSQREAQEVKSIIRTFKQTMTARTGNPNEPSTGTSQGLFLSAPSTFQLEYKTGSNPHPYLNRFKPCALSDISVNYTASGPYATYADGSPVHIQMTLTFKEINPIYFGDYDTDQGQIGVGY